MIQKFEYRPSLIVAGYVDVGLYLYYFCIFRFWKKINIVLDDTQNIKSVEDCAYIREVKKSCEQYKYTCWLSAYVYEPNNQEATFR